MVWSGRRGLCDSGHMSSSPSRASRLDTGEKPPAAGRGRKPAPGEGESDGSAWVRDVTAHAERVFGSPEVATAWLSRPNRELSGKTPLSLLAQRQGAERVDAVLGRIEHGVIA